jgi:hypothetical protein
VPATLQWFATDVDPCDIRTVFLQSTLLSQPTQKVLPWQHLP